MEAITGSASFSSRRAARLHSLTKSSERVLRPDLRQTVTVPSNRVGAVFYLSTDLFIILIFAGLALWIAVGIFSSRLESEVVCPNCDTQGLPEMTRRGLKDIAVCQTCGFTLGGLPVVLRAEGMGTESDGSPDA